MRRFFHSSAAHHSLCKDHSATQRLKTQSLLNVTVLVIRSCPHCTEMSDELLGNFHPFQEFLQETISKSLLNGRDLRLHIFKAPEMKQRLGLFN